jgi:hypothetical protein
MLSHIKLAYPHNRAANYDNALQNIVEKGAQMCHLTVLVIDAGRSQDQTTYTQRTSFLQWFILPSNNQFN